MGNVQVGLLGAGRMGAFHGESIAFRVKGADLYAVADPVPGNAEAFAKKLGSNIKAFTDPLDMLEHPAIDAVIIASPARTHAANIIAAAKKGKAVFCEKPMAVTLEEADEVIRAVNEESVPLQVGFNRRFAKGFRSAYEEIRAGKIGTPQLMRSITRDPALGDPTSIPQWTIFLETLIHDFDTLLFLNPNAKPIEVYAAADALVRPDFKDKGFLDTAVVTIKFDNGAIATAEANFQAVYGYDVRGEVFGSEGMLTIGDIRHTNMTRYNKDGVSYNTIRYDQDLLFDAYVDELQSFVDAVRNHKPTLVTGEDARAALAIAAACIESCKTKRPVTLKNGVPQTV
ncbi:Gfo/Idh/MocA family oxidoreductase [Bacillus halotolerans]|uniref:Gfo/Idh/MocA family oxidoreductase n=1 Tax=Bacillus TaxID=1386 RepID=UPI000D04637D|nr:Gfo/Idh/MocA family oxidoreductase [Bacillus halotolerans]MBV7320373.1 Gfo/Idh/MocA family oxidoreductase [Halalkalibacterium halodurans]AZV48815.1 dehydrogenase [Bacillus halotolerans]MCP9300446.1 Gfo/Idh/MocA family oxidoreductase [Bacillus halotolerans]PRS03205.1 dehydrogenase [Bacillus halotolerans]PRS19922.1 dehydrogenase [Bacillus halotolerans]